MEYALIHGPRHRPSPERSHPIRVNKRSEPDFIAPRSTTTATSNIPCPPASDERTDNHHWSDPRQEEQGGKQRVAGRRERQLPSEVMVRKHAAQASNTPFKLGRNTLDSPQDKNGQSSSSSSRPPRPAPINGFNHNAVAGPSRLSATSQSIQISRRPLGARTQPQHDDSDNIYMRQAQEQEMAEQPHGNLSLFDGDIGIPDPTSSSLSPPPNPARSDRQTRSQRRLGGDNSVVLIDDDSDVSPIQPSHQYRNRTSPVKCDSRQAVASPWTEPPPIREQPSKSRSSARSRSPKKPSVPVTTSTGHKGKAIAINVHAGDSEEEVQEEVEDPDRFAPRIDDDGFALIEHPAPGAQNMKHSSSKTRTNASPDKDLLLASPNKAKQGPKAGTKSQTLRTTRRGYSPGRAKSPENHASDQSRNTIASSNLAQDAVVLQAMTIDSTGPQQMDVRTVILNNQHITLASFGDPPRTSVRLFFDNVIEAKGCTHDLHPFLEIRVGFANDRKSQRDFAQLAGNEANFLDYPEAHVFLRFDPRSNEISSTDDPAMFVANTIRLMRMKHRKANTIRTDACLSTQEMMGARGDAQNINSARSPAESSRGGRTRKPNPRENAPVPVTGPHITTNPRDKARAVPKEKGKSQAQGDPNQAKLDFMPKGKLVANRSEPVAPPRRSARQSSGRATPKYADGETDVEELAPGKAPKQPPADRHELLFPYPLHTKAAVNVTRGDLWRVVNHEFLNDILIEFGLLFVLENLQTNRDKVHLFNSFFYNKLSAKGKNKQVGDSWPAYDSVKKWTKGRDIFEKDFIIVPINEDLHWYLAIIYNPAGVLRPKPPEPTEKAVEDLAAETQADGGSKESSHQSPEPPDRQAEEGIGQTGPAAECEDFEGMDDQDHEGDISMDPLDIIDEPESGHDGRIEKHAPLIPQMQKLGINPPTGQPIATSTLAIFQTQNLEPNVPSPPEDAPQEPAQAPPAKKTRLARQALDIRGSGDAWILVFDSLGSSHTDAGYNLGEWLRFEARTKRNVEYEMLPAQQYSITVPAQNNFSDCGLYLIHYAERLLNEPTRILEFIEREVPASRAAGRAEYERQMNEAWLIGDAGELRKTWSNRMTALRLEYEKKQEAEKGETSPDKDQDQPDAPSQESVQAASEQIQEQEPKSNKLEPHLSMPGQWPSPVPPESVPALGPEAIPSEPPTSESFDFAAVDPRLAGRVQREQSESSTSSVFLPAVKEAPRRLDLRGEALDFPMSNSIEHNGDNGFDPMKDEASQRHVDLHSEGIAYYSSVGDTLANHPPDDMVDELDDDTVSARGEGESRNMVQMQHSAVIDREDEPPSTDTDQLIDHDGDYIGCDTSRRTNSMPPSSSAESSGMPSSLQAPVNHNLDAARVFLPRSAPMERSISPFGPHEQESPAVAGSLSPLTPDQIPQGLDIPKPQTKLVSAPQDRSPRRADVSSPFHHMTSLRTSGSSRPSPMTGSADADYSPLRSEARVINGSSSSIQAIDHAAGARAESSSMANDVGQATSHTLVYGDGQSYDGAAEVLDSEEEAGIPQAEVTQQLRSGGIKYQLPPPPSSRPRKRKGRAATPGVPKPTSELDTLSSRDGSLERQLSPGEPNTAQSAVTPIRSVHTVLPAKSSTKIHPLFTDPIKRPTTYKSKGSRRAPSNPTATASPAVKKQKRSHSTSTTQSKLRPPRHAHLEAQVAGPSRVDGHTAGSPISIDSTDSEASDKEKVAGGKDEEKSMGTGKRKG